MMEWPKHCKTCQFYGWTNYGRSCDYIYITGKSKISELGVDESLPLDERTYDLCRRCTHWKTEDKRDEKKKEQTKREQEKAKNSFKKRYALYEQGMSDQKMGELLGVTEWAISYWRRANGLVSQNERKLEMERQSISDMWSRGFTDAEIAEELGKTRDAVRKIRHRMGLKPNGQHQKT